MVTHTLSTLLFLSFSCVLVYSKYCKPSNTTCWPSASAIGIFHSKLHGHLIMPGNMYYHNLTIMKYLSWTAKPAMLVLVLNVTDVQVSLDFGKKYNIQITIQSTGHDMNGRSTATGSLQINFHLFKNIKVNLNDQRHPAGSVTAQPGALWIEIYKKVNRYKKQVVGGSCPTVSVSGFTMGGGHSPLTRSYGLAVDNVLEFDMVLANRTLVTCSAEGMHIYDESGHVLITNSTELFWAVRGGGGGTYGILTSITFKLHNPPTGLVTYNALYGLDAYGDTTAGKELYKLILEMLPSLPKEWGGYLLSTSYKDPKGISTALLTISLLQNAHWTPSTKRVLKRLLDFKPEYRAHSVFKNYSTFLEYQLPIANQTYYYGHFSNAFFRSTDTSDKHLEFYAHDIPAYQDAQPNVGRGMTCVLIRGNGRYTTQWKNSAISSEFRHADLACTAGLIFSGLDQEETIREQIADIDKRMSELGHGAYQNEAAYAAENYTLRFWGENYMKLSEIKKKYDPDNVFTCHHCVGSSGISSNSKLEFTLSAMVTWWLFYYAPQ